MMIVCIRLWLWIASFPFMLAWGYSTKDSVGQKIVAGKRCLVYKIESGNTLSGIAEKYKTNLEAIKSVNPAVEVDKLEIGQLVNIPRGNAPKPQPKYYTVKSGDTPGGIASAQGISLTQLYALNGFKTTPVLQIGQKLMVGNSTGIEENTNVTHNSNNNTNSINPNTKIPNDEVGKKDVVDELFTKPFKKNIVVGKAFVLQDSVLKPDTFAASHKTIKIGTIVTVTNVGNKKSVYVRIEANHSDDTYVIKLTPAAAEMLKTTEKEFTVELKYVQ